MRSCCPAEEARLLKRGRTFEDPEEFRHADQLSAPLSPSDPSSAPQKQASSNPINTQVLSEEQGLETATQQQQLEARASFSKEDGDDTGASITSISSSGKGNETPPSSSPPPLPDHQDGQGHGGTELKPVVSPNESLFGGGAGEREPYHQQQQEEEDEDEEFKPRLAMSAKSVVRQRRQWALRRARRREGPNEANQLELGGGSPAGTAGIREAWVETVVKVAVTGRDRAEEAAKGAGEVKTWGGGHDDNDARGGERGGVVELLVSP